VLTIVLPKNIKHFLWLASHNSLPTKKAIICEKEVGDGKALPSNLNWMPLIVRDFFLDHESQFFAHIKQRDKEIKGHPDEVLL